MNFKKILSKFLAINLIFAIVLNFFLLTYSKKPVKAMGPGGQIYNFTLAISKDCGSTEDTGSSSLLTFNFSEENENLYLKLKIKNTTSPAITSTLVGVAFDLPGVSVKNYLAGNSNFTKTWDKPSLPPYKSFDFGISPERNSFGGGNPQEGIKTGEEKEVTLILESEQDIATISNNFYYDLMYGNLRAIGRFQQVGLNQSKSDKVLGCHVSLLESNNENEEENQDENDQIDNQEPKEYVCSNDNFYFAEKNDLGKHVLYRFNSNENKIEKIKEYDNEAIKGFDVSPLNNKLYSLLKINNEENIGLYELNKTTGQQSLISNIENEGKEINAVDFHPNGSLWAYKKDRGIGRIDLETGIFQLEKEDQGDWQGLAWDKTGTYLYGVSSNNIYRWDLVKRQIETICSSQNILTNEVLNLNFNKGGYLNALIKDSSKIKLQTIDIDECKIDSVNYDYSVGSINSFAYEKCEPVNYVEPNFNIFGECQEINEDGSYKVKFGYNNNLESDQVLAESKITPKIEGLNPNLVLKSGRHEESIIFNVPEDKKAVWEIKIGDKNEKFEIDKTSCPVPGVEESEGSDNGDEELEEEEQEPELCRDDTVKRNYTTLGEWDDQGKPLYLDTSDEVSDSLMDLIDQSLPESKPVQDYNPSYIANEAQTNIELYQEANVWVTYVDEGASYKNSLGYYTYDLNNPPQKAEDINELVIIFPNTSNKGSGGSLEAGNKVNLGLFPANTGIGWFLIPDGWENGEVDPCGRIYFSNYSFNPEESDEMRHHNVQLYFESEDKIILGFEDLDRDKNSDDDFNDAIYYITVDPLEALNKEEIVTIDENGEEVVHEEEEEEEEVVKPIDFEEENAVEIENNNNEENDFIKEEEPKEEDNKVVFENQFLNIESDCVNKKIIINNLLINSSNKKIKEVFYSFDYGYSWNKINDISFKNEFKTVEGKIVADVTEDKRYGIKMKVELEDGSVFISTLKELNYQCYGKTTILGNYYQNGFGLGLLDNKGDFLYNEDLPVKLFAETMGGVQNLRLKLASNRDDFSISTEIINMNYDYSSDIWEVSIPDDYVRRQVTYARLEIVNKKGQVINSKNIPSIVNLSYLKKGETKEKEKHGFEYQIYYKTDLGWEELDYNEEINEIEENTAYQQFNLFSGNFYIKIKYDDKKVYYTKKFELNEPSLVRVNTTENNMPFFLKWLDPFIRQINVSIFSKNNPPENLDFKEPTVEDVQKELLYSEVFDKKVKFEENDKALIFYWNRWNPHFSEQLDLIEKLYDDIANNNRKIIIYTDEKSIQELIRIDYLGKRDINIIKIDNEDFLHDELRYNPEFIIYNYNDKDVIRIKSNLNYEELKENLKNIEFIN